jgi:3-dehydrosphinganine reductase
MQRLGGISAMANQNEDKNVGRVALITGGSSGIGEAYATYFLQTGGFVSLVSRNEERLAEAKKRMQDTIQLTNHDADERILCLPADVRDATRAEEVMR